MLGTILRVVGFQPASFMIGMSLGLTAGAMMAAAVYGFTVLRIT